MEFQGAFRLVINALHDQFYGEMFVPLRGIQVVKPYYRNRSLYFSRRYFANSSKSSYTFVSDAISVGVFPLFLLIILFAYRTAILGFPLSCDYSMCYTQNTKATIIKCICRFLFFIFFLFLFFSDSNEFYCSFRSLSPFNEFYFTNYLYKIFNLHCLIFIVIKIDMCRHILP